MSNLLGGTDAPPPGGDFSVGPASAGEIQPGLAIVLGSSGRAATSAQVGEFLHFADQRRIDVRALWVARDSQRLIHALLPVISPGRTMLLFIPSQSPPAMAAVAQMLLESVCHYYAQRDIHLAQVLLEATETSAQAFFADHHFVRIAELIYLQGPAPRGMKPAPRPALSYQAYSPANHMLLAQTISESYRNSLDCPALNGKRDIEDVIAGHKATGDFVPDLWQILCENNNPLGVLLLSSIPHSDALELVYLGLVPAARGRGFGDVLMQRAMQLLAGTGRRRLTLAVDSINTPALRLYYRYGLQRLAAKVAMIRDLR